MRSKTRLPHLWLSLAASVAISSPAAFAALAPEGTLAFASAADQAAPAKAGQNAAGQATSGQAASSQAASSQTASSQAGSGIASKPDAQASNRASAYFHAAMASLYEEQAANTGRPEFVQHAVEEYKAAINADPGSAELYDGLADLYFRSGKVDMAESTARELLKTTPNDIDAHRLLGRIYLRELGDQQNAVSSASPSGNTLDQAIAEYEKIVSLQPKSVDDHMVLGQLYTVKHQTAKAEAQFKIAQDIEPDSEDVLLSLSHVYAESNDLEHAAKVLEAVPEGDRTARIEFNLGVTYEQLKREKDAIAAFRRANELQPGDAPTMNALAQALLNDNQLDEALKVFQSIAQADPEDAAPLVHIAEIQRRQGKYDDALVTIRKARKKDPDNLEAGYNEGLLLDVLGRYDEAAAVYEKMVDQTSHANGAYTAEEKNNRAIFLARLGAVYHEQNKTDQAIAIYQKMIAMGGDTALQGYQGEVDTYRDAHMFDKEVDVARQASDAQPKDRDLKLMLASALVDAGKPDEAISMAQGMLDKSDNDRQVYFLLANVDTRLRRYKEADEALTKAAPLATKKDDKLYLLFLRGALEDRQKHMEQAEQYFRQALDVDPTNAMTLNYLGYMFADKGVRLPEAIKLIRKAIEIEPMNGAYLDSLGWAYFKLGEYELAEENLRHAVERDQTDPTVHDHLGHLYEKTGRIRQAAAQWELSLAEYAKTPLPDVDPGDVTKVQHKLEGAHVKLAKQESASGLEKPE